MNLWNEFKSILPDHPTLIGKVLAHMPDGTSAIEMLGGGLMRVAGQDVEAGKSCFVQDGRVIGEAPDLPKYEFDI